MAEQRAAPHPTSMEAGQQCLFPESIGVKRGRAPPPIAPARLAPAASSVPERVKLTELAALAEMADDETVAALRSIVSPGHAGSSTCSPAQASHRRTMPAQATQQMQMYAVPERVLELAEQAADEESQETVPTPQGIVRPGHAGTGLARALGGVPWAALADRWRCHWEAKRTSSSSSASVTASTYSHRSSFSSGVSGPAPGNAATPAPALGAPAVPPEAPPVSPPASPVAPSAPAPAAPPPLSASLAQVFDEPIGPGTAPTAPPAAVRLASESLEQAKPSLEQQHSTLSPAQTSHRGGMPAQATQQMQSVIVQSVSHLPIELACSTSLQHLADLGADDRELHFLFARLFTPKHPSTLPKSQWLSYTRLFLTVQPYAPARVWKQGRGNLKQLVIEWCQHHPVFVGLAQSAWCRRLKDDDQPQAGRKQLTVYKFCLACSTPHDA